MEPGLNVAVVGAGPAGLYVADALTYQDQVPVCVDVFDRLPTPFGLLRYGVAPDHLKIKSVARALQRTLDHDRVRFFGNVELGRDVSVEELREIYDAVFYTYGAATDRSLDIPGEDLPGSTSATDFVAWYSAEPDNATERFDLRHVTDAVVVGMGNVAVDVARILSVSVDALRVTDIPEARLEVLARSAVTDVHMLGRRGPVHAKFTSKELKELGDLEGVDMVVDPGELVLGESELTELAKEPALARNLDILRGWSVREPTGAQRRLHLHFWSRPVRLEGDERLAAVEVEPTVLRDGRVVAAGPPRRLPAQLLLRSVGYRGIPIPGVPFDGQSCTVPNESGRVLREGVHSAGEYVAGWVGRGPVGVLGTNRSDATQVVAKFLADAPALLPGKAPRSPAADVTALLRSRGVALVDGVGWGAIDAAEIGLGSSLGRTRVKLATRPELLAAAQPE